MALLCLAALPLSEPARAGSYAVATATNPSGGTAIGGDGAQEGYYNGSVPYTNDLPGYGAETGASSGDDAPGSCSGGISTAYTWQQAGPADLPPQSVIVDQGCIAGYSGSAGVTGDCVNGLGDPPVPLSEGPGSVSGMDDTGGAYLDHYSAQAGGGTVTVTAPGSPHADGTPGGSPYAYSECWAFYTSAISPVTIQLTGATPDGNGGYTILIGQGCTASLTGIPSSCTVTYQWTITGHALNLWEEDPGHNFTVEQDAQGTTNQTNPHWYWSDNATTEDVQCTATVTPPSGEGAPFTVTATQGVALVVPSYTDGEIAGISRLDTHYVQAHGALALWAGPGAKGYYGCEWDGSVTVPPPFAPTNAYPYNAAGSWYHTQLITKQTYRTPAGGTAEVAQMDGVYGLDASDPYGQIFPADGILDPGSEGDSPGFGVEDAYFRYEVRGESFDVYAMFQPDGSDVIAVPLYKFTWNWTADAVIPAATPPAKDTWATWNNNYPTGTVTITSGTQRTVQHPSWAYRITPGW